MTKRIALSGNCYWCLEACLQIITGVTKCNTGYYSLVAFEELRLNQNDKVEVVYLEFDEAVISIPQLLDVYFDAHNPTLNSWHKDHVFYPGTRPAIFYDDDEDLSVIEEYMVKIRMKYEQNVNTKLIPYSESKFVGSSDDNFYLNHPSDPYCQSIIVPKLEKINANFKPLITTSEKI